MDASTSFVTGDTKVYNNHDDSVIPIFCSNLTDKSCMRNRIDIKQIKLIGKGGYGKVYRYNDNVAIKSFDRSKNMVYELAMGIRYVDHPNIIKPIGFDIHNRLIIYPLYDTDAHKWLKGHPSEYLKIVVIEQVMIALAHIHSNGHVHCDVKPMNILIKATKDADNTHKLDVVLADLGILSHPGSYCKAMNCAEFYRDDKNSKSSSHDVFSLGITCLMFFCAKVITKKERESNELLRNKALTIRDKKISSAVYAMLHENPRDRPSISDLYNQIFGKTLDLDHDILSKARIKHVRVSLSHNYVNIFKQWFDTYSARYGTNKKNKFEYALVSYLDYNNISRADIEPYVRASFYLMSVLYGKRGDTGLATRHEYYDIVEHHRTRECLIGLLLSPSYIKTVTL